jgi:hypothetical protein
MALLRSIDAKRHTRRCPADQTSNPMVTITQPHAGTLFLPSYCSQSVHIDHARGNIDLVVLRRHRSMLVVKLPIASPVNSCLHKRFLPKSTGKEASNPFPVLPSLLRTDFHRHSQCRRNKNEREQLVSFRQPILQYLDATSIWSPPATGPGSH